MLYERQATTFIPCPPLELFYYDKSCRVAHIKPDKRMQAIHVNHPVHQNLEVKKNLQLDFIGLIILKCIKTQDLRYVPLMNKDI